jgi:quinol monooxygenase YgiN
MEDASGAVYGVTHVDVIPPQKDNALVALKALGDANRAAAGNVRFEIVQQTNRPNHFTVFEVWRSREAFDANGMSAHQREFRDKLSGMAGALYDERLYEILD